jgi:hypothetical protein
MPGTNVFRKKTKIHIRFNKLFVPPKFGFSPIVRRNVFSMRQEHGFTYVLQTSVFNVEQNSAHIRKVLSAAKSTKIKRGFPASQSKFCVLTEVPCSTAQFSCRLLNIVYLSIFSGSAAQRGLWPPRLRGFLITHNNVPQSVGLLWTSDQLVAETST